MSRLTPYTNDIGGIDVLAAAEGEITRLLGAPAYVAGAVGDVFHNPNPDAVSESVYEAYAELITDPVANRHAIACLAHLCEFSVKQLAAAEGSLEGVDWLRAAYLAATLHWGEKEDGLEMVLFDSLSMLVEVAFDKQVPEPTHPGGTA